MKGEKRKTVFSQDTPGELFLTDWLSEITRHLHFQNVIFEGNRNFLPGPVCRITIWDRRRPSLRLVFFLFTNVHLRTMSPTRRHFWEVQPASATRKKGGKFAQKFENLVLELNCLYSYNREKNSPHQRLTDPRIQVKFSSAALHNV